MDTIHAFPRAPRRSQASQPAGRKIVAQCVSTGRATVPPQPRNGAEEAVRRSFFRPVPGLANGAGLLPTALRRGLLSVALRALRAVSFAACRYVGQDGILRAGWQPAPAGPAYKGFRRVTNPPQVASLPHNFCRIPVRGKTKWHWPRAPAPHSPRGQCEVVIA